MQTRDYRYNSIVVGYPSYRVSDPHVRVPLVLTAVDLEVVRWELVLGVDLVS